MHYLDNAATTIVDPEVAHVVSRVLREHYANPSSLYAPGMHAQQEIETARRTIATALGLADSTAQGRPTVLFTASGTEANNMALLGAARARQSWGNHLVTTGYEHPSVQNTMAHLAEKEGFKLTVVPPQQDGTVSAEALVNAVARQTAVVTLVHVNNETGATLDAAAIAAAVKQKNSRCAVHVDAVQSFTKLPLSLDDIDSASLSAHKLHAPKGVGALYLRPGHHIEPTLFGGEQEAGLRPGTENTAYIAAFAAAVRLALQNKDDKAAHLAALCRQLETGLEKISGVVIHSPKNHYPGIVNFSVPPIKSEIMLHHLESLGVYVSSGSACSQGQPSHTLTAMGLPPALVDSAIRASFCDATTPHDVTALLNGLESGLKALVHA